MKVILILAAVMLAVSEGRVATESRQKTMKILANELFSFCDVCKDIVQAAEAAAVDSESALEKYVNQYCDYIPIDFVAKLCCDAVDALVPDLFKYITGKVDPTEACCDIHLCSASERSPKKTNAMAVKSGPFCEYCEEGVQAVDALLKNYVPNIVADIEQVCNLLPSDYRELCTSLLGQYLPAMIDKLIGMLDPVTLCTDMKLCDGTASITGGSGMMHLPKLDINWGTVECNFCQMIFNFIDDDLLGSDVEQTILVDLQKVCMVLPNQDYQQKCLTMIETYGNLLITYAKTLLDAGHVCPMIKMCPASN